MTLNIEKTLAKEFDQKEKHIENVIKLLGEGATIPFIARYRKELTGSMDDQLLRSIVERLEYLRNLEKRKTEVIKAITNQGKLTEELESAVNSAKTLSELEDIYRPFKQKRATRASKAREKGLTPLAELIMLQDGTDILEKASEFVNPEMEIMNEEDAVKGAMDIIAEEISDTADIRKKLRNYILKNARLVSVNSKDENSVYNNYYDFSEKVAKIKAHSVLAINRGEKEGFLKATVDVNREKAIRIISDMTVKNRKSDSFRFIDEAISDSYDRLIFPSLERETRNTLTELANEVSIKTFSVNLKQVLMQQPIKNMVTIGLDPAYRTGCKIAVVDGTGKVLDTTVIYPTPPHSKIRESERILNKLIEKYNVKLIAIGNGTASRESEQFVSEMIKGRDIAYVIVNEAGASVYSASKLAAAEFPEFDVALRSAVSIARRLQDPLAELVKIDPKSIGVGQYQHDMPKKQLDEALAAVVESAVNSVGVDLNTASSSLLSYVSGINNTVSKNIVTFREENGPYHSRKELMKVPKLGKKAFEQCAGFLRVAESDNPLDNSAVHPESYRAAENVLKLTGFKLSDINTDTIKNIKSEIQKMGYDAVAEKCRIGVPTLKDIADELIKPGRDPRDKMPAPILRNDVLSIDDLIVGMKMKGTVRNVVPFGAFVDIGVHQDGLIHISEMSDRYISDPGEIVKTGDVIEVTILDVDKRRNRIALSLIR